MFSQTAEYAFRAMVHLAEHEQQTHITQAIAVATKVPPGYLAKVLQALRRAGLVSGSRGLHGGFRLARPANSITLYEVLRAVDPIKRIKRCPLDLPGHGANLCPLHRRLDDALGMVEKTFKETTVANMLESKPNGHGLCPMPLKPVSDAQRRT